MKDMIQTQNFITRPIYSLDSIISKLINRARKVFLVNLWPILVSLNLSIGPKNHVILEANIQFHHTHLNLTKFQVLKVPSYPFPEIELEHESDW